MFKWILPTQKGTQVWPQVTRQPTKVTIAGVEPQSELARSVVNRYRSQIEHFHKAQLQNYSLSTADSVKTRRFYPIGTSKPGTGENYSVMVPGLSFEEASSTGAPGQGSGLWMTYTNRFGHERIDIVVSTNLLEEERVRLMIKPERDIELRGYICVHNPNIPDAVEAAGEPNKFWQLVINGVYVGEPRVYGVGEAVIFCVDGYRPQYHSVNDATNPFGAIGQPSPPHPHGENARRVQYPMFGIDPDNPVIEDYIGASDISSQGVIINQPAYPITIVDFNSEGVMDLLGENDVQLFEVPPDETESPAYGLIYCEFFGRYCREVESSWRFPRADIGGVARKILINDDPFLRGDEISGVSIPWSPAAGVTLDLRPPSYYADPSVPSYTGPTPADLYVYPMPDFISSSVDGYPYSLFDPWP